LFTAAIISGSIKSNGKPIPQNHQLCSEFIEVPLDEYLQELKHLKVTTYEE